MASIDYGAILKVNDKFINKDCDLFMRMKDCVGFTLKTAYHNKYGDINIDGNYFVYAGDENLLMCFYKGSCVVVSNGVILGVYSTEFKSETFFLDETKLTISRLDNTYKKDEYDCKYRSYRFKATWEYKGNKYECIYGYGIETYSDIWEEIRNRFDYSKKEVDIIDSWFN